MSTIEDIDFLPYHALQAEAAKYSLRRNLGAAKLRSALKQLLGSDPHPANLPAEWFIGSAKPQAGINQPGPATNPPVAATSRKRVRIRPNRSPINTRSRRAKNPTRIVSPSSNAFVEKSSPGSTHHMPPALPPHSESLHRTIKSSPSIRSTINRSPIRSPINRSPIRSPINRSPIRSPINRSPIRSPINRSPIRSPINRSPLRPTTEANAFDEPSFPRNPGPVSPTLPPYSESSHRPIKSSPRIRSPINRSPLRQRTEANDSDEPSFPRNPGPVSPNQAQTFGQALRDEAVRIGLSRATDEQNLSFLAQAVRHIFQQIDRGHNVSCSLRVSRQPIELEFPTISPSGDMLIFQNQILAASPGSGVLSWPRTEWSSPSQRDLLESSPSIRSPIPSRRADATFPSDVTEVGTPPEVEEYDSAAVASMLSPDPNFYATSDRARSKSRVRPDQEDPEDQASSSRPRKKAKLTSPSSQHEEHRQSNHEATQAGGASSTDRRVRLSQLPSALPTGNFKIFGSPPKPHPIVGARHVAPAPSPEGSPARATLYGTENHYGDNSASRFGEFYSDKPSQLLPSPYNRRKK